jgi:hypothetical protein
MGWGSASRHGTAALYPRERTPVPIGQEAGWAAELVWRQRPEEKSFASSEDLTPVVQPEGMRFIVRFVWA